MYENSGENAVVDLSYLLEYTRGDEAALEELIEVFYESFSEDLQKLERCIADEESAEWSSVAHKLKGAAGFVGAQVLRTLCAEAQQMKAATAAERQFQHQAIKKRYKEVCAFLEEERRK